MVLGITLFHKKMDITYLVLEVTQTISVRDFSTLYYLHVLELTSQQTQYYTHTYHDAFKVVSWTPLHNMPLNGNVNGNSALAKQMNK